MRKASSSISIIASASLLVSGCASPFYMGQQPSTQHRPVGPKVPGEQFADIKTIAVVPSATKPTLDIAGDYLKAAPSPPRTVVESTADVADSTRGGGIGVGGIGGSGLMDEIIEDPRIIVMVPFMLVLAPIVGYVTDKALQQIQEMRDAKRAKFVDDLEFAEPTDALAAALETRMQRLPQVDASLFAAGDTLPDDIDAVLQIDVTDMIITINGTNATLQTQATATLSRPGELSNIFRKEYQYKVRESMGRWAQNDYELLKDYEHGARHHLARLISDEFFGKVRLRHVLRPVNSGDQGTLAWELVLLGEAGANAWANVINDTEATFEIEIYDGSTLAFATNNLTAARLKLTEELQPCTSFHWTVRPIYQFEGIERAGEWMSHASVMHRMYAATGGVDQLAIREITDGYPEFKTRCR